MTKREAAIVSAYTGYLIGEFKDFHAYVEEIMGRPVFTHELPSIADELKEKSKKDFMSIKIEEKEDPPEFLAKYMNIRVPDCNDCGYLNFTEKEQQVYGINSYKKDHRCKCYDRPVYHRTNSTQHNPYIHPCEECYKDGFVNYIKRDKEEPRYTCSDCSQCRYDEDEERHYCRRSYYPIYAPEEVSACDDLEKGE